MAATDLRLEAIPLPVSDVDRAKQFYVEKAGFALDVDHVGGPTFRVVQCTPPGSACSIMFGLGIIDDSVPGTVRGLHLVVEDIVLARDGLAARGVDISPVRHMTANGWADGVDPAHTDYNSFADFADPDGNSWALQERGHSGS